MPTSHSPGPRKKRTSGSEPRNCNTLTLFIKHISCLKCDTMCLTRVNNIKASKPSLTEPHQEGTENPPKGSQLPPGGGATRKTLVPDEPFQVDDRHFKKVPNNKQQMRKSTVDTIRSGARLKVSRGPFLQSIKSSRGSGQLVPHVGRQDTRGLIHKSRPDVWENAGIKGK